jgi:hypothetical protein
MMSKPKMRRALGVRHIDPGMSNIVFHCSDPSIVDDIREYGSMYTDESEHTLYVDARFDFYEVLDYVRTFEEPLDQLLDQDVWQLD